MEVLTGNRIGLEVAAAVEEKRLWDRHVALAAYGRRDDGGVNRQALSIEDIDARKQLLEWTSKAGYRAFTDAIGNLFIRREGRRPDLAPVLTGSHLDSQPAGGRFDGVFGVLAALEVLHALDARGVETERPVEIVVWTNEEGSRFSPGMTGSAAFVGALDLRKVMASRDEAGVRFGDALSDVAAAFYDLPQRTLGFPVAAYVEAHIEQGPVLEQSNCLVGAVSGIQGTRWFSVTVTGKAMHAGTVPTHLRKDAFKAVTAMVNALNGLMMDETDTTRFTVGRVIVQPNSPNTIPGSVIFTIDFRHPDAAVLDALGDQIEGICQANSGGCEVLVEETLRSKPIAFEPSVVERIVDAARALGVPHMTLPSGAFHDAKSMSLVCPTGMIFVPCAEGISHSPEERAEPDALAAGARVLAAAIVDLAQA